MQLKKVFNSAAKTAQKSIEKANQGAKKLAAIELPHSLEWLYGLGFKIGLFLALKTFLILRYLHTSLAFSGFVMLFSQFLLGLVLMLCGVLMQNKSSFLECTTLRIISALYGTASLLCSVVIAFKVTNNWNFFKESAKVNWFVDFFSSIFKGAKELTLGILFCDCDLWVVVCVFLFLITLTYLYITKKRMSAFVFPQSETSADLALVPDADFPKMTAE